MLLIKQNIKPYIGNNGNVKVWEFGGLETGMDIGVAELKGFYPGNEMWSRNKVVEQMSYYCLSGKGKVIFEDGRSFELVVDSCVFIPKEMGYQVVIPEGETLKVLMASHPAWSSEQYEVYKKE